MGESGKCPVTFLREANSWLWEPAIFSGSFRWVQPWPWHHKSQSSEDIRGGNTTTPFCSLGQGPEILMGLNFFFSFFFCIAP